MTTTAISAQTGTAADDIQIVHTPPTVTDAQLVLQQQLVDATTGANRGVGLLTAFETPPTLAQLRKRHPVDSTEYGQIMAFLGSAETTATFVKHGLLNEALVDDLYWISGAWRMCEKVVKGIRKEAGEPRLYENAEWLARRGT